LIVSIDSIFPLPIDVISILLLLFISIICFVFLLSLSIQFESSSADDCNIIESVKIWFVSSILVVFVVLLVLDCIVSLLWVVVVFVFILSIIPSEDFVTSSVTIPNSCFELIFLGEGTTFCVATSGCVLGADLDL
jgi:hypothetical protein